MFTNLSYIIEKNQLDQEKLALELFPNNKFPKLALKRVLDGKSFLDTNQLTILANIVNVSVYDLFNNDVWSKQIKNNKLILRKNTYTVEFDLTTYICNIFAKDKLIASETIIFEKNIKLSDFLESINKTIINLI